MHYYQFNIGDYATHTRHLSIYEDIAYRRLLDWYYLNEKPIPCDAQQAAKLILMRNRHPDVECVLQEFFQLTENGWINKRADAEISKFKEFSEAGKRGAAKRWSTGGDSPPIAPPIANNNHKPLTNNQEPITKPLKSKDLSTPSASTAKKGTRLPEDWQLSKAWGEWAASEKPNWTTEDIRRVAADFKDHFISVAGQKGLKLDWLATWRKWVRSPLNEIKPPSRSYSGGVQEARLDIAKQIFGDRNGTDGQIIDITTSGAIEGNGNGIQENVPFLRGSGIR